MFNQHIGTLETNCAKMFTAKTAVVSGDIRLTYEAFHTDINRLANALQSINIKPDDRVCLLLPNSIEYLLTDFAIAKIGAIKVPLLSRLHIKEWAAIVNDSGATTIIFEEVMLSAVIQNLYLCPNVKNLICINTSQKTLPKNVLGFYNILKKSKTNEVKINFEQQKIFALMYTGGTTGKSKGVIHTHETWISIASGHMSEDNMNDGCVTLHAAGLPHATGFFVLPTMLKGGTNVILNKFDPKSFYSAVEKERVTHVFLAPTMVYMLLDYSKKENYDISSLRCLLYGGAPFHTNRLKQAIDFFGPCLKGGYAQMEAANMICRLTQEEHIKTGPDNLIQRLASCGRPVNMVKLRIVNHSDNDVNQGETGEIIIQGPHVMKGYWNNEKETSEALRNGWLHTGDLGRMDQDGYIYIMDRKKDMIITGGLNVYSRNVEDTLCEHPEVIQAAVIGLPDPKWGERVTGVVVLQNGAKATSEEIIGFCKRMLTDYKCPKQIEIIKEMPLTPVGKIDKKQIRAQFN